MIEITTAYMDEITNDNINWLIAENKDNLEQVLDKMEQRGIIEKK